MADISKQGFKILDEISRYHEELIELSQSELVQSVALKNKMRSLANKLDKLREDQEVFLEELQESNMVIDDDVLYFAVEDDNGKREDY